MPGRSLWSGTVSFGLVSIPVNMVPAVRPQRVQFHILHRADNARLSRRMYCPEHNAVVHPEHMIRGYEVAANEWVTVTEEELESLEPKRSRSIEITDFVGLDAIPAVYYDRPYYLVPDGAEKPYGLLVEALSRSRRAGIARFVMHGREHLVAVRAIESALCLMMLHYAVEVRSADELAVDLAAAEEKLVRSMRQAAKKMSGPLKLDEFENEQMQELERVIAEKRKRAGTVEGAHVEGQEESAGAEDDEAGGEAPVDLVAALEASLAREKSKRKK